MAYLDTSVLGSYYCPESLSAAANSAVMAVTEPVISPLVEIEFSSLLSLKVRSGAMTRVDANIVLSQFRQHVADGLYRLVELGSREHEMARNWLARFDAPLRTLDALHLAAAMAHRQEMITSDKLLGQAARKLGIKYHLVR